MKKDLVKQGYNEMGKRYLEDRDQYKSNKYLKKLDNLLKPGSVILDIGCGSGKPIDEFFAKKGYRVMGIDVSEKQIDLAKKNVPQARYKVKDVSNLQEREYRVDAIISFYTIFHIPRETHLGLFKKFNSFLPKGGLILITMGSSEWEGTEEDFHGVKMSWSHYGPKKNREIIKEARFEIVFDEIDSSGGEKHQVILARKT